MDFRETTVLIITDEVLKCKQKIIEATKNVSKVSKKT